jgi:hypothetical protein
MQNVIAVGDTHTHTHTKYEQTLPFWIISLLVQA